MNDNSESSGGFLSPPVMSMSRGHQLTYQAVRRYTIRQKRSLIQRVVLSQTAWVIPLTFSFPICKMEIIKVSISKSFSEN
jgi:hypothetical protein